MVDATTNPHGIRDGGRALGGRAQSADAQGRQVRSAADAVGVQHFTGGAGDRMRTFLTGLESSSAAVAKAYEQLAVAMPRVAEAVELSQKAKQKLDSEKKLLAGAVANLAKAEAELAAAKTALLAAKAANVALALLHHKASTAAEEHAVEVAQKHVVTAQKKHETAVTKEKAADTAFGDAEDDRERASTAFAKVAIEAGASVASIVAAMPGAPQPPAIAGQLGTLGTAESAIKTILAGKVKLIKGHYNPLDEHGLPLRDARSFGPNEAKLLDRLGKLGKGLDTADTAVAFAVPFVSSTLTALHDPTMTRQQQQDFIANRTLLEGGGGFAGGFLCAPLGFVASAGCGWAGGEGGKLLEKSHVVRRLTDGLSHKIGNPGTTVLRDIVHRDLDKALKDSAMMGPTIQKNLISTVPDTLLHPSKLKGFLDAGNQDAKGVGHWLKHLYTGDRPDLPDPVVHSGGPGTPEGDAAAKAAGTTGA